VRSGDFLIGFDGAAWFIARPTDEGVDVHRIPIDADAAPEDHTERVADELTRRGYRGGPVCLGLPSDMVLTATIETDNLPRSRPRTAMLYRLEEQLPLDAESLTADFFAPLAGRCLAVAVETERIERIVDALVDHGVDVAAICPTAMLTVFGLRLADVSLGGYVVLAAPHNVDVLRMADGTPTTWYTPTDGPEDLARCIEADLLTQPAGNGPAPVHIVGGADDANVKHLADNDSIAVERLDEDPLALALRAAEALTAGRGGWIDLRRDQLAPPNPWGRVKGSLRTVTVLAIVLLASLAGTFLWRSGQYSSMADDCRRQMQTVYRTLHPNRRAATSVRRQLEGELKQLAGLSGTGQDIPPRPNALDTLRSVVAHLPSDTRLRITEMRLDPMNVSLHGEVLKFADAERIAETLKEAGFEVDPPRSERKAERGVAFTLTAKLPSKSQHLLTQKAETP